VWLAEGSEAVVLALPSVVTATWADELEVHAPDIVGAWRGIEVGGFGMVRREVRSRSGPMSAVAIVAQLDATASAILTLIGAAPDDAFELPGGEADWTVAQAIGHDAVVRAGLVMASALAASGTWPANALPVVPSVPGRVDAGREDLAGKIAQSQRIIARSATQIARHETDACPLDHPLVGRLRCGEWLLFAGIHDAMHLEQLHRIAEGSARGV
jgi:hypothetical protein